MHRLTLIIKVSLVAVSTIHTCRTSYIVHGTGTSLLLSFYSPQSIIFLLFFFFGWFDITRAMLKLSWNFIALSKYHCCVVRVFFFVFICVPLHFICWRGRRVTLGQVRWAAKPRFFCIVMLFFCFSILVLCSLVDLCKVWDFFFFIFQHYQCSDTGLVESNNLNTNYSKWLCWIIYIYLRCDSYWCGFIVVRLLLFAATHSLYELWLWRHSSETITMKQLRYYYTSIYIGNCVTAIHKKNRKNAND